MRTSSFDQDNILTNLINALNDCEVRHFHKIVVGRDDITDFSQLSARSQRQFVSLRANTDTYLYSFYLRTIRC